MTTDKLEDVETFHQLLEYAESEFRKAGLDRKRYWQGVKDGIRRAGVVLGAMSERSCVEKSATHLSIEVILTKL